MYTKKVFKASDMVRWTRFETFLFLAIVIGAVTLHQIFELDWLEIPWTPLALIGTAVAFVIGFQNNAAYGRIWEARKIWGGIVNTSRTLGMFLQDMVTPEHSSVGFTAVEIQHEVKTLTYRHIAWMTALRHAMRAPKPWETVIQEKTNKEGSKIVSPPERSTTVEKDMEPYLSEADLNYVMSKDNKQTALLYVQSHH